MAERGKRTALKIGRVAAEVSLLKASAAPADAKYETRRVVPASVGAGPSAPAFAESPAVEPVVRDAFGADDEPAVEPVAVEAAGFAPLPEQQRAPVGAHIGDAGASAEQQRSEATEGLAQAAEAPRVEPKVLRGVTGPGGFVDLTGQLAAIDASTKIDGMELLATVARSAIPAHRVRDSYYMAPAGAGAPKVLALLWSGLREAKAGAVVRWTKTTNQALGLLVPSGTRGNPCLMLLELEWSQNMKPTPKRADLGGAVSYATPEEEEKALALVNAFREPPGFLQQVRDERMAQRAELLAAAREGKAWEAPAAPAAAPEEADAFAEAVT